MIQRWLLYNTFLDIEGWISNYFFTWAMSNEDKGFIYTWKIENFSMLPHQRYETLSSPVFVIDMLENVEWYLNVFPRGERCKKHLACCYHVNSNLDLTVRCSFTIESTEPTVKICKTGTQRIRKGWFGSSYLISLNEIHAKKHIYLPEDILTIRFHVQALHMDNRTEGGSPLYSNVLTKYAFRSCIEVQRKSITWPIQTEELQEETFIKVTSALKHYPGLKLSLNFADMVNNYCIPIEIRQTNLPLNDKLLFAKCKITVMSGDKEYQDSKEHTHLFESRLDDVWYFPPLIKTSKITRGKYLYVDDILLLHCEFVFSYKDNVYHWETNYVPFPLVTRKDKEESEWCSSIKNLFATQKFSDVELKVGGESFPAYRVALCAKSTVFTAMFENDMKEKNSGVVEIDDIDPTTLGRVLTFLHIDVLEQDLSLEDVFDLYRAADKYAIESLKRWCSISLISSLSVASVCDILTVADTHKDNFLMVSTYSFIRSHADEVFYSEFWKSFMDRNLKLSAHVMYQMLTKKL